MTRQRTAARETSVEYEMIDSQRGAELAIIISYPTSASGIIVLLKTIKKCCYIFLISV